MPTLYIRLLGDFRLVYADEVLASVNTPRLQALLVYLLLHRQAPQSRQHIAFQFWPDSSEKQAHTNLRKLLFQLRSALPDPDRFLVQDHLTVHWRPDAPYLLDVAELTDWLARCRNTNSKPIAVQVDELTRVADLYQGELLPSCLDEWLLPVRQQLQREVMGALEQLISLSEHQREYQAGIRYAQRLLGLDPLHETGYRRLMQLHASNGDRAAALHHYHTCVTILQRELGVDPDEETRTLYEQLLKQDNPRAGAPATVTPLATPLVGRQTEWAILVAAWRRAQCGEAHFVALAGETGMGKSRLAEELANWVRAQGGGVAQSRSYEAEGGLVYTPVVEWLRSPRLQPLLAKLDKPWLSEVARLLPELLTAHPGLSQPGPLTEAWERQRFFEALARAVLLDKGPLLLVIDDLQWCDGETVSWLRYLLRYAPQARLLIVGTWRSEAVDDRHPLSVLLRDLQRANQITTLELTALSIAEAIDLAQRVAERTLTPDEAAQLVQATEGHPLFIVETVRADNWHQPTHRQSAPSSPHAAAAPFQALPPKIQATIQARLAQLSAPAREVAGLAATIGRQFSFAVLQRTGTVDEDTLIQALDELWQRRMIREQGADAYDFSHDKIREVAYQGVSQVRRRLFHRRVVAALEQEYTQNLAPILGQLAVHYELAQLPAQAFAYWVRTAQRAEALDAYPDADAYYQRALALHQEQLAEDMHSQFDLLLLRSALAERQGQSTKFAHDVALLFRLAVTMNEPSRLAQAQLRQASYWRAVGKPQQAMQAGEQALALYRVSADKVGEIHALRELGFLCWSAQDYGNALRYGREVLQLHRQQSDVRGEASALHNLAEIYRAIDSPSQAITFYEQALQLYWGSQDQRRQSLTLYSLAYAFRQVERADRALSAYQQAITQCEQTSDRLILSRVYHAMATLHWEMQQTATAVAAMQQAVTISQTIGYLPGAVHGLLALGYMTARLGQRAAAQRHLQAALTPLRLMEDVAGLQEVEQRLQWLAAGQLDLPEPPSHMNWIRTHIVLAEGKVYCEFESPGAPT